MSVECGSAQTAHTADDRPDPSSLTSTENSTEQSTSAGSDRRVLGSLTASATSFDRAFHVDFLA